jgi:hypothetical protein
MPLPKLAEDYLQEIARVPPRRSQASALSPSLVVAAIEWRRIPFARMRREPSRRRRGSAPSHPSHFSSSVAVTVAVTVAVAVAPSRPTVGATMPPDRSVRCDGVVVDNYAADGAPDSAGMATRSDGCGGVGSEKNGVGGGSSTDRDNNDNDANGNRRRRPRPRHCSRQAATAVAMMTMAGERGVRRRQGNCRATTRQRRCKGNRIWFEFTGRNRPEGAMLPMDGNPL